MRRAIGADALARRVLKVCSWSRPRRAMPWPPRRERPDPSQSPAVEPSGEALMNVFVLSVAGHVPGLASIQSNLRRRR